MKWGAAYVTARDDLPYSTVEPPEKSDVVILLVPRLLLLRCCSSRGMLSPLVSPDG